VKDIKFSIRTAKIDADDAETHFLTLFTDCCSLIFCELHAFIVLFYAESVGVVTSNHVTKTAFKPFDPPLPTPLLL